MTYQTLRLQLNGMTACDYLAHLHDPEPAVLGAGLRSVVVEAEPLTDVVEALLTWERPPSDLLAAARLAGFPVPADVVDVQSGLLRSLGDCDRRAA